MNGHVVLHGAEEFHYGGFFGMPVFRGSGKSFVAMVAVCADCRIVIPKRTMRLETWV